MGCIMKKCIIFLFLIHLYTICRAEILSQKKLISNINHTHRYLVLWENSYSNLTLTESAIFSNDRIIDKFEIGNSESVFVIEISDIKNSHNYIDFISDYSNVKLIEPIMTFQASNQFAGRDLWNLDVVDNPVDYGLDRKYTFNYTGIGVNVHILDTGVNIFHDEFKYYTSDISRASVLHIPSSLNDHCDGLDCNGHGTHVAALACGRLHGTSKLCNILSSPVLDKNGFGTTLEIITVLDYIKNNRQPPEIIVMCLGGPYSKILTVYINQMSLEGYVFVVAAGNDNKDACVFSPASAGQAITVGSHDQYGQRSPFSNHGECVDLYAPGVEVRSAYAPYKNSYRILSGTSMSAPLVAGIVAQMLEQNSFLAPREIKELLLLHAKEKEVSTLWPVKKGRAVNSNFLSSPCSPGLLTTCIKINATLKTRGDCNIGLHSDVCDLTFQFDKHNDYYDLLSGNIKPFRDGDMKIWAVDSFSLSKSNIDIILTVESPDYSLKYRGNGQLYMRMNVDKRYSITIPASDTYRFALFIELPIHCSVPSIYLKEPCDGHGVCDNSTGLCDCEAEFYGFQCEKLARDSIIRNWLNILWKKLGWLEVSFNPSVNISIGCDLCDFSASCILVLLVILSVLSIHLHRNRL
jgi:hypothetical protein